MHPERILNWWKYDLTLHGCLNPRKITFRLIAHFLIAFLSFGTAYCFDTPGALQDYFQDDLKMPTEKFIILYSIYSWANIIMGFVGGYLLDRVFGIKWGTIIYIGTAIIGHLTFATGTYVNVYWLMVVGRFIFGIGAESVITAQNLFAALWFKNKELHLSFGLQMSLGGIGSAIDFLTMEKIYGYVSKTLGYEGSKSLGVVLFLTTLAAVASLIGALFLRFMDSRAEETLIRNENQKNEIIKFKDIKNFKITYWLTTLISFTYYISIIAFLSTAKVFFITKYKLEPNSANTASSLIYWIPALTSPMFGILIDKIGKNIFWLNASVSGALLTHGLLAFTRANPYVCMVILGISYSLFSSCFKPTFIFTVSEHELGTAYGLASTLVNLGFAVYSIASGIVIDHYGYIVLETIFFAFLLIAFASTVAIWILQSNDVCYPISE